MPIFLFLLGLIFSGSAWSYPQFIGYKYSSCLTCHYNGNGNGPLNDYGRALWSAEIASRQWSGPASDEELAEASGFLGKDPLPWWIRPGIKARELVYITNPGNPGSKTKFITMQAEANVALFLDKNQKSTFVASYGYVPKPQRYANGAPGDADQWISREHYFRYQAKENLWFYVGMMDKVYGIRHINHTAYSRSRTGLSMNDQSHGIVAQYINPKFEWSVNGFIGNLFQDADLRQKGFSTLFEWEKKEAWRLGFSALYSANNYVLNQRLGVHSRYGFGYGSALLAEFGLIDNTPKVGEKQKGYYIYSEAMQRVARGYHLFLAAQAYKDDMTGPRPDNVKTSIGLLSFPIARAEFRAEIENTRQFYSTPEVPRETWGIMAQIHLSL